MSSSYLALNVPTLFSHFATAAKSTLHSEDWTIGDTWCVWATCDPDIPAYMPWGHGTGGVIRSCTEQEPPYNVTPVDSFNITVWSAITDPNRGTEL